MPYGSKAKVKYIKTKPRRIVRGGGVVRGDVMERAVFSETTQLKRKAFIKMNQKAHMVFLRYAAIAKVMGMRAKPRRIVRRGSRRGVNNRCGAAIETTLCGTDFQEK